jgi:hypothetical protein
VHQRFFHRPNARLLCLSQVDWIQWVTVRPERGVAHWGPLIASLRRSLGGVTPANTRDANFDGQAAQIKICRGFANVWQAKRSSGGENPLENLRTLSV